MSKLRDLILEKKQMRINVYDLRQKEGNPFLEKIKGINYPVTNYNHPDEIVDMMCQVFHLDTLAEEKLFLLCFDTKMKLLGISCVCHGSVNMVVVGLREIYIRALLMGAVHIAICHNHPSGDPTPSKEDVELEERLRMEGDFLNVKLLDNIIVGKGNYYSTIERKG